MVEDRFSFGGSLMTSSRRRLLQWLSFGMAGLAGFFLPKNVKACPVPVYVPSCVAPFSPGKDGYGSITFNYPKLDAKVPGRGFFASWGTATDAVVSVGWISTTSDGKNPVGTSALYTVSATQWILESTGLSTGVNYYVVIKFTDMSGTGNQSVSAKFQCTT